MFRVMISPITSACGRVAPAQRAVRAGWPRARSLRDGAAAVWRAVRAVVRRAVAAAACSQVCAVARSRCVPARAVCRR
eukprot:7257598-Prymnesium_polylepis.2